MCGVFFVFVELCDLLVDVFFLFLLMPLTSQNLTFVQDVIVPRLVSCLDAAQGTPSAKLARLGKDLQGLWSASK